MFGIEEEEGYEGEIIAKVLPRVVLAKVYPKKQKQLKKLKSGGVGVYNRVDHYIRLPSRMQTKNGEQVMVLSKESFNELLTIKALYGLSDVEFALLLNDIFQ